MEFLEPCGERPSCFLSVETGQGDCFIGESLPPGSTAWEPTPSAGTPRNAPPDLESSAPPTKPAPATEGAKALLQPWPLGRRPLFGITALASRRQF